MLQSWDDASVGGCLREIVLLGSDALTPVPRVRIAELIKARTYNLRGEGDQEQ